MNKVFWFWLSHHQKGTGAKFDRENTADVNDYTGKQNIYINDVIWQAKPFDRQNLVCSHGPYRKPLSSHPYSLSILQCTLTFLNSLQQLFSSIETSWTFWHAYKALWATADCEGHSGTTFETARLWAAYILWLFLIAAT